MFVPQELNYSTISKTIAISGVKQNMDTVVLPLLRSYGVIDMETYCGNDIVLTYASQVSCSKAYHSIAQGDARRLCHNDDNPFV